MQSNLTVSCKLAKNTTAASVSLPFCVLSSINSRSNQQPTTMNSCPAVELMYDPFESNHRYKCIKSCYQKKLRHDVSRNNKSTCQSFPTKGSLTRFTVTRHHNRPRDQCFARLQEATDSAKTTAHEYRDTWRAATTTMSPRAHNAAVNRHKAMFCMLTIREFQYYCCSIKVAGTVLICIIFMICGYRNYANSDYVISQELAHSTTFYCFSRHRPSEIGCKHETQAALHASGRTPNAVAKAAIVEGRGRRLKPQE